MLFVTHSAIAGAALLLLMVQPGNSQNGQGLGQSVKGAVFVDQKNGYFTMIPPSGWQQQSYDDTRTKVAWRSPQDTRVLLSVIDRQATESFKDMRAGADRTAQSWRSKGVSTEVSEGRVGDVPAVVIKADMPGMGISNLVLFLVQGIHFNAQFAAPNRELFDQHLPHAMEALGTIAPLPQSEASATRAPAEELAWYKRYAFLLQKLGDRNNARALAKEGLAKFPSDAELLKLAQ